MGLDGLVCAGETRVVEQEAMRAGRNPVSSTEHWAALQSAPVRLLTDMPFLLRTDVPVSQSAGGMWGKPTPHKAQRRQESGPGECESTELCSHGQKPEISDSSVQQAGLCAGRGFLRDSGINSRRSAY